MPLTQRAQGIVDGFTATLNAEQRNNFTRSLQSAPGLVDEINAAVDFNRLRSIGPLPRGVNAGAAFDPSDGQLQLPLSMLNSPSCGRRPYDPTELVFAMSHECRHASNRRLIEEAERTFAGRIDEIARTPQPIHDYSAPLRDILQANRRDEANAHIAGFNAVVSQLRVQHPQPTLQQIYDAIPERMRDFIDRSNATPPAYTLRPGLSLSPDMSMPFTSGNIESMGRYYYDRPASSMNIGDHGLSDYQNLYAPQRIGEIVQAERRHAPAHMLNGLNTQMALNMVDLRLDERQIERNGLHLGFFGGSQRYFNSGQIPYTEGRFDHTIDTHRYVATAPTVMPQATHPAVQQALDAMGRSPNIPPNAFGEERTRVATGMALHAANEQVRTDHIVMNDQRATLIAVQGTLGEPTAILSSPLPVAKALTTDLASAQADLERLQPIVAMSRGPSGEALSQHAPGRSA